jgi:methionyl-tRNA formyltransferase
MSKIRVIFLCGHKSPYGLAHLNPLLQSNFDIISVVLATDERWDIFSEKLLGKNYYPENYPAIIRLNQIIKMLVIKILPEAILRKVKKSYKKPFNIIEILKKYKIPIWYVDNVNSREFIQRVKNANIDLILSAAYPQIFSDELISIPTYGAVNFHPSLLPKFRGAHPHYWAIVKGETESGLSAHFMTKHIDDGDIIAQIKFPIKDYDYRQLYEKIIMETPSLVKKVEEFFYNRGKSITQDPSKASYFRNDREIHHRIFWNIYTSMEILNLVRGGNAFCFFRGQKIIVEKCFITETNRNLTNNVEVENGVIVDLMGDYIAIKAKSGVVNIQELRCKYRNLSASKFIIKYKPLVGEKFD